MEWPALPYAGWSDTCTTLQMWTQVVGKIRMEKTPPINHWWHVTLYVTSRGLGTSLIPDGERTFEIDFDFLAHRLTIVTTDGNRRDIALEPMTVAEFYDRVMRALRDLKIEASIKSSRLGAVQKAIAEVCGEGPCWLETPRVVRRGSTRDRGPEMLRYLQAAAALDPQPSPLDDRIRKLQAATRRQ